MLTRWSQSGSSWGRLSPLPVRSPNTTLGPHFVASRMEAMSDQGWPGVDDRQYSRALVSERSGAMFLLVMFAQLPRLTGAISLHRSATP